MVQDTGKAPGTGAIKPLDEPVPVKVKIDSEGRPVSVRLGRWLQVAAPQDRWRIDDEWWRERPISRLYHKVLLEDGREITIFHDLITDSWYRQGYG